MRNITEIIERNKQGINCTEQESAEIKGYLKELNLTSEQLQNIYWIMEGFPIESGEVLYELNNVTL